jgi:hypothetical protein
MGRSVTRTDFRHRLVFSGVYDLPFGKGRQFRSGMCRFPELLLGGWQIHGIDVLQSGSLQGSGAAHTAGISRRPFGPTPTANPLFPAPMPGIVWTAGSIPASSRNPLPSPWATPARWRSTDAPSTATTSTSHSSSSSASPGSSVCSSGLRASTSPIACSFPARLGLKL